MGSVDCLVSRERHTERREPHDPGVRPHPGHGQLPQPEGMHRPTGYTHVVEVTAGRPVYIDNLQAALGSVGAGFEQVVKLNLHVLDATQLRSPSSPDRPPAA